MNKTILAILILLSIQGCTNTDVNSETELPLLDFRESDDHSVWRTTVKKQPLYPDFLVRQGVEGCVRLIFEIKSNGRVGRYQVVKSIPKRAFDKESIETLPWFEFVATEKNPNKQSMLTSNTFLFTLPGPRQAERLAYWSKMCQ